MATPLLDSLSPGYQALSAQLAAAGIDAAAILAAGPSGLKSHIESLVTKAVEAARSETAAALEKAAAEVAAAQALAATATAGQQQAESTLGALVSKVGLTVEAGASPEQITKAVDDRISLRAGEELAKRGVGSFPASQPEANPIKPGARLTLSLADFKALSPEEKMKFSKAGGSITD